MNTLRSMFLWFVLTVPLVSNTAWAEELLISLTPEEQAGVLPYLRQDLLKVARFGKQHRIVRIDPQLLPSNPERISISPFNGITVKLVRTGFTASPDNSAWEWRGRYAVLPFARPDFQSSQEEQGADPAMAGALFDSTFTVRIVGTTYSFLGDPGKAEPKSAVQFDERTKRWRRTGDIHADDGTQLDGKKGEFVEITADFQVPSSNPEATGPLGAKYSIRSLPTNRLYHVVYEVDPNIRSRYSPDRQPPPEDLNDPAFQRYRDMVEKDEKQAQGTEEEEG